MKKFASVLIAAILAAFALPAPVRAGGGTILSISGVPSECHPGAEFSIFITATTPIYGATLYIQTVSGFETAAPPGFGGVRSGNAGGGVSASSDPSRGDLVNFVAGFSEPRSAPIATLSWVAGDPGCFGFRITGVATDGDLYDVPVDMSFVVHVRLFGDMDYSGVVDIDDVLALASGLVGWGGPRWTIESHRLADMYVDDQLNHMDVVNLMRHILGLPLLFGGPAGKIATGTNPPEVIANARKALADLGDREGQIVDQLRSMILELVPEAAESAASDAVGVPTAIRSSSWGAIKASMME